MGRAKFSRRTFLKAGGVVLLAAGAVGAFVRTRGYAVPAGKELRGFSPWQYVVFASLANRIAARDDATMPTAEDAGVADFVDGFVEHMQEHMRRDLGRLLAYVENVAPVASGFTSRFSRLDAGDQDEILRALEASRLGILRGGFAGLKSLVFMGYYRDVRTWRAIGYDGPLVGRPRGGWK